MRRGGAFALAVALLASACASGDDPDPTTTTSTAAAGAASSPTVSPSPTTSPSPTATPTDGGELTTEAALAAAAAHRRSRPECVDAGPIVDDFHRVVLDRGDVMIVFVTCFVGAYQASGELLAFDGELRRWPVEQWSEGEVVDRVEVVGEVGMAPDGLLENLEQYRALGDCGLLQRWEVVGERVVLVEAREQPCDDAPPRPVTAWPLVHES